MTCCSAGANGVRRLACVLLLLLCSMGLWAEELTVLVRDPDLDLPLQGAVVTADSVSGKTDAAGKVTLSVPDGKSIVLVVTYPGYATSRTAISAGTSTVTVSVRLASVVSGPALVVEKAKPDQTDAEPGVSQVIPQETIKSTAEIGVFEDLMASLRLFPGVGYGGNFNAQPSVRGGDPSETVAYLDGAPFLYPYHWGGVVSLFDPNFVASAKLSDGVISARYGDVLSGVLEITSKSPLTAQPRLNFGLSTTGLDAYIQYPLSDQLGILAGGKVTWMEVPFAVSGVGKDFNQVPYIRDGYTRVEWKPVENLDWTSNFFYGTDGFDQKKNSTISLNPYAYPREDYRDLNWEVSSSLKWLWTEHQLFSVVASVNSFSQAVEASNPAGDFDNVNIDAQEYALSAEWDIELGGGNVLAFGASDIFESVLNNFHTHYVANNEDASIVPPRNYADAWSGYALDRFIFLSRHLEGELGLRVDGVTVFGDGFSLTTTPVANPRLRLQLNPFPDNATWRGLEFHAGSGLYSQIPLNAFYFSTNPASGVVAQSLDPERSWIAELGSSLSLEDGWRLSIDGYYKAYWDRLYEFYDMDLGSGRVTLQLYNDGIGYATGAEVMVQKVRGRFWDGWIDYTFNVTRYLNPSTAGLDPRSLGSFFPNNSPVGIWYYPIYQRLHTVNLVFNWKPTSWLTVTTVGTFATGTPPFQEFPNLTYTDSARNPDIYDLNLKVTWHGYYHNTKVGWEFYVAVQNLLVNLLGSGTVANETGDQANFNLGYPIPSFGFKLSY